MSRVSSLLNMRGMLLRYSFEPSPYSRALDTAGSAMTIGYQLTDARTGVNLFDERKQD